MISLYSAMSVSLAAAAACERDNAGTRTPRQLAPACGAREEERGAAAHRLVAARVLLNELLQHLRQPPLQSRSLLGARCAVGHALQLCC